MRISQPAGCEVTTHILRRLSGQFEVSLAVWHVFTLGSEASQVEDSRVLWKLAKQHWPARALDEGFPKAGGEFFCFGVAYPPADLSQGPFIASVRVGQAKRDLAIYGQRIFGLLGSVQEVTPPRNPVPISLQNAFGGASHATNPDGVGYLAKSGQAAPSVEDPNDPITSPTSRAEPAGFWPLPVTSEQRSQHLGTFDRQWLEKDWPNFAPDTNMAFFQMAHPAQQLPGSLVGDEVGEIVGMHPTQTRLLFNLPGKRVRCVFKRTHSTNDLFEGWAHTTMQPETLYLFPNEGVGVLLHRGLVQVDRADALDLAEVLFQLEPASLNTPPSDIMMQLYRARWLQPTEPPATTSDGNLAASTAAIAAAASAAAPKRVTRSGNVKLWPEFEYVLSQPGISAETAQAIREAKDPVEALAIELRRQLRDGRAAYEAAIKDSGLTEQTYLQALSEVPQIKQVLGVNAGSFSLSVELERLTGFVDTLVDNLRRSKPTGSSEVQTGGQVASESAGEVPDNAPDAETLAQIRGFMQEQASKPTQFRGMNLSGLYLVGLDLAGQDFSHAICEGTQFRGCNLAGATFSEAILTRADFTHSKINASDFSGSVCQQATFDEAVLTQSNLTNADLTDCSFKGACFDGAILKKAKLSQSDLTGASFVRVVATESAFNESLIDQCDFTGAELGRVDFIKARISNSKFNEVTSDRLEFSGAALKDCQFTGSVLRASVAMLKPLFDGCRFENTDLSGSNWSTATIINSLFSACTLDKLDLSSGQLQKTRFSRSQAFSLSFFSCTMQAVDLVQNNLMQASFHGTDIKSSSMMGNNMYGADFTESKFDDQTAFEGNVILKTCLVWRGQSSA
ncbi:MAG TPA: DUF2169 domain-containing protein [Orrella sp.]